MRPAIYTVALLAFAISACRKDAPSPAEATPPVESATPAPAPTPKEAPAPTRAAAAPDSAPVIELELPGKPPLHQLRWRFKKGQEQTVSVERTLAVSARAGEGVAPRTPGPTYRYEVALKVTDVDKDGGANVALVVNKADADTEHASRGMTKDLQETHALNKVRGLKGRYHVATNGVISGLTIDAPEGASHRTHQAIEALRLGLLYTTVAVPEEAVGQGCKWTVTGPARQFEIETTKQITAGVSEFDGDSVGLRMIVNHVGDQQTVTARGEPPQVFELMSLMDQSMGDGTWNLTSLAPERFDTAKKLHMKIRNPGITGEVREMETLRETTFSLRGK